MALIPRHAAIFAALIISCARSHGLPQAPPDAGPCSTALVVSRGEAICVDEVTVCPPGLTRVCVDRSATITMCGGECDLAGPWTSLPTQPDERCHRPDPCGRDRTHRCVPESCL